MNRPRPIAEALAAGLEFILQHQHPDGSWSDWSLPPGPSDAWTTAYIGCHLSELPRPWRDHSTLAGRAAARWLVEHESYGGGWGYNASVGPDADSTAHALLCLSGAGIGVSRAARARLLEHQQVDGGFSTYTADAGLGSWGSSHPDVTAVAARALLGSARAPVARAAGYLQRARREDGTWHSFWWSSPLYATAAALSLLRIVGDRGDTTRTYETISRMSVANAFERALLLRCRVLTGLPTGNRGRATALIDDLVSAQRSDGSWASTRMLRLTNRDCASPAPDADAGPLYADPERLFTTATVLGALGFVQAAARPS